MKDLIEKVAKEVKLFEGLAMMNLAYSAVAMGIAISAVVMSVLSIVRTVFSSPELPLLVPPLAVIAGSAAVLAAVSRWFRHSELVMDEVEPLGEMRDRLLGASEAEEQRHLLIELIVALLARYREHRESIRALRLLGSLSGLLFVAIGILGVVQVLLSASSLYSAAGILAATMPTGVAGLFLSNRFGRYQDAWDSRLLSMPVVEEELGEFLGLS